MLLVHGWIERHREAVNVLGLRGLVDGLAQPGELAAELLARIRLCCAPAPDDSAEHDAATATATPSDPAPSADSPPPAAP
jgi:hypothetical protein